MAQIEVFYKPVVIAGVTTPYYHEYLVYTDDSGHSFITRGGPNSNENSGLDSGGGSGSSGSGSGQGSNIPFGNIATLAGVPYTALQANGKPTPDFVAPGTNPGAILLSGTDETVAPYWNGIVQFASAVPAENIPYGFAGPNSNTVVNGALAAVGLSPPPNQGLNDLYPAPGADVPLSGADVGSGLYNTLALLSDYAEKELSNIETIAENAGNSILQILQNIVDGLISSVSSSVENIVGQDASNGITSSNVNGSTILTQASQNGEQTTTTLDASGSPAIIDVGSIVENGNSSNLVLLTSNNIQMSIDSNKPYIIINNGGIGNTLTVTDGSLSVISQSSSVTINGGGNAISAVAGSNIILQGTDGNYDNVSGSGIDLRLGDNVQANANLSNAQVALGTGDAVGVYGGGDAITTAANTFLYLGQTNGNYDNVDGNGTDVSADVNVQANVSLNNAYVTLGTGDAVGVYGGGNTITTAANTFLYLGQTNGNYDNVGGAGTDMSTDANVQANVNLNNAYVTLGTGDAVGVYGGGNTITTNANDFLYLGQTNGNHDSINGTGQDVVTDANVQADVFLNSAQVTVASGSSGSVTGTNDVLTEGGSGDSFNVQNTGAGADIVNFGSGDYAGLLGSSNYQVNGSGGSVATSENTSFNLSGQGDYVTLASNSYLGLLAGSQNETVAASNSIINTQNGTSLNLSGNDDTVNLAVTGGSSYLGLLAGSQGETVAGSGDTINTQNDTSFNLSGNDDSIGLAVTGGTAYLGLLSGSQSESVTGSGDTIKTQDGTSFDLSGNDDDISLAVGGGTAYLGLLSGSQSESVTGSGDTIKTQDSTSFNLSGNNDNIGLAGSSYLGLLAGSQNEMVTASGDTINTQDSTSFNLVGDGDNIGLAVTGGSAYLGLLTGSQNESVTGSGDTIMTQDSTSFNLTGDHDEVDLAVTGGTASVKLVNDDQNDTIQGSGDNIALQDGVLVTVTGDSDTVTGQNADTVNFTGPSEYVNLNNSTINLNSPNEAITVDGSLDTVKSVQGNETVAFTGTSETADMNGATIYLNNPVAEVTIFGDNDVGRTSQSGDIFGFQGTSDTAFLNGGRVSLVGANETVTVHGDNDAIGSSQGGETLNLYGNGDSAIVSGSTIYLDSNAMTYGIDGSHDTIDSGSHDQIHTQGSYDNFTGGSNDQVYVSGQYDLDSDGNSPEYTYGNNTGDRENGPGAEPVTSETGGDDYDYDDGEYDDGDWDFAGGATREQIDNAPAIAIKAVDQATEQYVQSLSSTKDGVASAETSAGFSDQAPSPFEGAEWHKATVTWSLATAAGAGGGDSGYGGTFGTQDQSVVQEAMSDWAKVSGLSLIEDESGAETDIKLAWGDFDTGNSAILGYTAYQAGTDGSLRQVDIHMEDPNETSLTQGADGMQTYSGTSAELYQVALHEIGHALGLADDTDPNSVMYYASSSGNRSIDATDIANIHSLYAQPGSSMSETSSSPATTAASDPSSLAAPPATSQDLLQHAA